MKCSRRECRCLGGCHRSKPQRFRSASTLPCIMYWPQVIIGTVWALFGSCCIFGYFFCYFLRLAGCHRSKPQWQKFRSTSAPPCIVHWQPQVKGGVCGTLCRLCLTLRGGLCGTLTVCDTLCTLCSHCVWQSVWQTVCRRRQTNAAEKCS